MTARNDDSRSRTQSDGGGMSPGVAVVGFLLCFLSGAGIMWGVDSRHPNAAGMTADTSHNTAAGAKVVNPGAVPVDLHVMAQCPYGVQAENAFKDVVAKFGGDLDLHVEYIGQVQGGEPSSMHGPNEVKGDLLQVCAAKYAPAKAFDFILCQNENSKEVATSGASCAARVGAPADKITACAEGPEGKELLLASFKRSQEKGANGSPTIFVAGNKYEGGRKPTDFMKAICNGASGRKPAACADIPEAPKVNVTILSDNRCGADCDANRAKGSISSKVGNPVVNVVDYASPEGRKLFGMVKPAMLPAALFDTTLDADKDALAAFSRGLKDSGGYKVLSMGGWNPQCADDGGCNLSECKATMQCRVEEPKKLDVYVMSQCPYGVKGLDAMKEVVDNFKKSGDPINFAVHYIGDGDATSLSSMHGAGEVAEDVREECAIEHYGKSLKFMDYVWCRNKNIRDANWESCTGGSTGIDAAVIKRCAEGDEGKQLVAKSFAESKTMGIGASPTWLANNKYKFSGIDAQTIKTNLCQHNPKLHGCDATLSGQQAPKPGGAKEPGCGG